MGFNPGQPRDDHGRWTSGGGAAGGRGAKLAQRAADVRQSGTVTIQPEPADSSIARARVHLRGLVERYGVPAEIRLEHPPRPGAAAYTMTNDAPDGTRHSTIYLDPEYWAPGNEGAMRQLLASYAEQRYGGRGMVGDKPEDIVSHEYGHALAHSITDEDTWQELNRDLIMDHMARDENGRATNLDSMRSIVSQVSTYAASNPDEHIAEAFNQHVRGAHNRWSDHVGTIFDRTYRSGK